MWSYVVHERYREEFRRAYGPDGEWADLFRRSADYRGTDLFEDRRDATRFLTVDHFVGSDGRARFLERHQEDYRTLDARWEHTTLSETFVGEFATELRR